MPVAEIEVLQSRYARLADRFKSIWTYHQLASGIFRNFLGAPVPYSVDFKALFDTIKAAGASLKSAPAYESHSALEACDFGLDRASMTMLSADDRISTSLLRRFFERLKKHDDAIIHALIKFYLYADEVDGDRRDKLDFFFTRIGEDYVAGRGEYATRASLEFRERLIGLVVAHKRRLPEREEVLAHVGAIHSMRDDIRNAAAFDELTQRNLLKNARTFKHRVGDLYFDPDVLTAIVELNIDTKNRFLRLYESEEAKIVEDSEKLMEHGSAIERNFGESNPELMEEIARFREFKERFDSLRAQSNVKHDVIAQLKSSMNNILAQLDRGLAAEEHAAPEELPAAFFTEEQQVENVSGRFGRQDALLRFLVRIATAIDSAGIALPSEEIVNLSPVRDLRLEPWEIDAYLKLFERRSPDSDEETDELWILYLRAAALRIKVDEEATILATSMAASVKPENELLTKAKRSLDAAKELDEQFGDFLQEAVYYSNPKILHQLYRSRFRLLRGFSGLWLIYDQQQ